MYRLFKAAVYNFIGTKCYFTFLVQVYKKTCLFVYFIRLYTFCLFYLYIVVNVGHFYRKTL